MKSLQSSALSFCLTAALMAGLSATAQASSHREAPSITKTPKVDASDFYLFNSYEEGREDYVTIVANYQPLQDAYGGPNYFFLDDEAIYEIHISNDGGAGEDLTFRFNFTNTFTAGNLQIGGETVEVPFLAIGPVTAGDDSNLLLQQTYNLSLVSGDRRLGVATPISAADSDQTTFIKPQDDIGNKTFPDYAAYTDQFIYEIDIPGSELPGRVFVGQRKDPFVVNLGETFDLINYNPIGAPDGRQDDLADANVTSIILEIPREALVSGTEPVIGGWTTASVPDPLEVGGFRQVSRLGMPLVNEVVIGVSDKDLFNSSEPENDGSNFLTYVTNPTLPELIEILFADAGVQAPNLFPRTDLISIFFTGIRLPGDDGVAGNDDDVFLTQPQSVEASEMLRLNTGIPSTPSADQNTLGVIGGDLADFPNGRRPGDDVVDVSLRAVMGVLLPEDVAPSGQLPLTDGASLSSAIFLDTFPYLAPPIPGSPNDPSFEVTLEQSSDLMEFLAVGSINFDESSNTLTAPRLADTKLFYRLNGETDGVELSLESVGEDSITMSVIVR